MAGLRGADWSNGQVSLAELTVEEGEHDSVKAVRQFGTVAWAFVAHESMRAVHLVAVEAQAEVVEGASTFMRPSSGMCGSCRPRS